MDLSNQLCLSLSILASKHKKYKPVSTKLRAEELAFLPSLLACSHATAGCALFTQNSASSRGAAGVLTYTKLNCWGARGVLWQQGVFLGSAYVSIACEFHSPCHSISLFNTNDTKLNNNEGNLLIMLNLMNCRVTRDLMPPLAMERIVPGL